ncbi:STAS domain-containing protein [Marinobacterium rhizophilum]|uniref:STAS domain-containing protein n=1 Tax=Marinobacterium rhizophilum TaxID=420402 RepID=UPI000363564C|nr:STAS domain-containing protein [Marinobacterium rhizophilum]
METGTVFYAKQGRTYVLKLVGELRYTQGENFNAFLERLFQRQDFDQILIDLSGTESIDSTMLGLLAKVANFMRDRFQRKAILVSTNENISQLLDSLGFCEVFNVCEQPDTETGALQPLSCASTRTEDMAATILEAHTILSEVKDSNKVLFRDVIDALKDSTG